MSSSKRENARIERQLAVALTEACEVAKAEIPGFEWLTHEVNHAQFQQSLRVIWVFDSQASKTRAVSAGQNKRMCELTAAALNDVGIGLQAVDRCVRLDSEEECDLQDGGDWRRRLARIYAQQ
jgi:hypothetical protein